MYGWHVSNQITAAVGNFNLSSESGSWPMISIRVAMHAGQSICPNVCWSCGSCSSGLGVQVASIPCLGSCLGACGSTTCIRFCRTFGVLCKTDFSGFFTSSKNLGTSVVTMKEQPPIRHTTNGACRTNGFLTLDCPRSRA